MLIGARKGAWSGGAKLPYDAEVEYIDTLGGFVTAYDDYDNDCGVNLIFEAQESTPTIFGGYVNGEGIWRYRLYLSKNSYSNFIYFLRGNSGSVSSYFYRSLKSTNKDFDISVNLMNDRIFNVNDYAGQSGSKQINNVDRLPRKMYIGRTYTSETNFDYSSVRIKSLKISDGPDIVRDFTPVRVGSVGALYDRIRHELYTSENSVSFGVGPDK